jgi:Cu/Ag efflux protein CusF
MPKEYGISTGRSLGHALADRAGARRKTVERIMKTFFGAVTVASVLAMSGLAMAQSSTTGSSTTGAGAAGSTQQATGTVSKIDRSSNTVTLKDGTSYKLSSSSALGTVKEGDQVRLQYQMQGSDRMATAVMPATGAAGSSGTTGSSTGSTTGSGGTGTQPKQ